MLMQRDSANRYNVNGIAEGGHNIKNCINLQGN